MSLFQLTSNRLLLQPITPDDAEAIHALHLLPETDAYNTLGIPANLAETQATIQPWINDNVLTPHPNYTFAIRGKEQGNFIGLIALKLGTPKYKRGEVWYKLMPAFWGKGMATEALRAVLKFAFETLQLHRVEAGCAVENRGSIRVLEKVGMVREGRARMILPLKSGWSDNFGYAILETDWFAQQ